MRTAHARFCGSRGGQPSRLPDLVVGTTTNSPRVERAAAVECRERAFGPADTRAAGLQKL